MQLARTSLLVVLFVAAALATTLIAAGTVLGVPGQDLPAVALLFAQVGGGVGLLALAGMQPRVLQRLGGVRTQLVVMSLLGSLLLLGLMLAGARAMFISEHDLTLLLTMLLFAAQLAVGLSLLWATPVARRIESMRAATADLAAGKLETQLVVGGRDEIAVLAANFNRMVATLQQAEAAKHALEQARRDLVAAVSHDLRTPLAATHALIEALADGLIDDAATEQRYLRSAQREIKQLSRLVDDLFELAQIDAGVLRVTLERASLHDLLSDTLSSFQPQAAERGVRLIGEVAGDIDPVLMSPPKLQRVLHNLVSNALRHTPSEGTIMLRAVPQGTVVEVEVVDTGEGIAPQDLPHIFEQAFRGERSRRRDAREGSPGAGLGLTIARGLVEAHGGMIQVWSEPGKGTRFSFTLQRAGSRTDDG
ncbi:MAG: HAMP domain-containing histidine kinase [Chloroflexota bacterium]|nr:HAMP domain-containing histidine kinase [Chloroflexota bacterium]